MTKQKILVVGTGGTIGANAGSTITAAEDSKPIYAPGGGGSDRPSGL